MSFTFTMPAPEGELFATTAFVNQVGRRTVVRAGEHSQEVIVLRAEVAPDGRTAQVTVDADLSEFVQMPAIRPSDFGFAAETW